jgi:hypothetical protein
VKPASSAFDDDADLMKPGGASFDLDFGAAGAPATGAAPALAPGALLPGVPAPSSLFHSEDGGKAKAARLGDYGDAPAEWWKAPAYAYRVKMRQLDLRRDLVRKRAELEAAQGAVEDALVILAERGRKSIETKDSYSKLLGAVISAEHTLRERDSALAAEADAHAKATAGLDAQISQHEAELAGARAEEKGYNDVFERVDAVRQRADAKVKRIDIDLRAAIARAGGAAGRKSLSDGSPASGRNPGAGVLPDAEVQARTAEREARLAELDASMPAVTEAAQKLTVARKKTAGIEQKMLVVKNERASLENQFRRRGAAHGKQVALAQKDVRVAMAALGRAMAVDTATFGAEWAETRAEIGTLDKAVTAKDDDVMLHVMALDAHDAPTVSKGLGLAVGAVVFLLLLVLIPVGLNVASNLRPPPKPAALPAADPAE